MSEEKNVANKILTAGDMSGSLTSSTLDISLSDNVGLHMVWTGTPTGTIAVQCSIDGTDWVALSLSSSIAPAGGASSALLDLSSLCATKLRVVYTRSSGTGTLDITAHGKGL